jgi:hypothetical protein
MSTHNAIVAILVDNSKNRKSLGSARRVQYRGCRELPAMRQFPRHGSLGR